MHDIISWIPSALNFGSLQSWGLHLSLISFKLLLEPQPATRHEKCLHSSKMISANTNNPLPHILIHMHILRSSTQMSPSKPSKQHACATWGIVADRTPPPRTKSTMRRSCTGNPQRSESQHEPDRPRPRRLWRSLIAQAEQPSTHPSHLEFLVGGRWPLQNPRVLGRRLSWRLCQMLGPAGKQRQHGTKLLGSAGSAAMNLNGFCVCLSEWHIFLCYSKQGSFGKYMTFCRWHIPFAFPATSWWQSALLAYVLSFEHQERTEHGSLNFQTNLPNEMKSLAHLFFRSNCHLFSWLHWYAYTYTCAIYIHLLCDIHLFIRVPRGSILL